MVVANPSPSEEIGRFDEALNHFERLGFSSPEEFNLSDLEQAYLLRAKRYHPDGFVHASSELRRRAMEHSSALNEAYQVLRDRVRRLEYLVKLGGIDLDRSTGEGRAPLPKQSFLLELLERREVFEQILSDCQGEDLEGRLEDLEETLEKELEEELTAAEQKLAKGEIELAAEGLVVRRYLQRMSSEVEEALQNADEA